MDPILFLVIAAGFGIFLAMHFWKKRKPYYRESMKPWSINHSTGLPDSPQMTPTGWIIDMPPDKPASLNYVQWYKHPPIREGQTITARIRVKGEFRFPEYGTQPKMTLLLHRRRGNLISPGYRYFSKEAVPLIEGDHTLTVPLTPEHWGDVLAARTPEGFRLVLAELESIGLIFGGDGGRGHGVVGGGASVELLGLEVS